MADDKKPPPGPQKPLISQRPAPSAPPGSKPVTQPRVPAAAPPSGAGGAAGAKPVTQPRVPAAAPRAPVTQPRVPATQPRAPVTQPRTPVAPGAKPAIQAKTPGSPPPQKQTGDRAGAPPPPPAPPPRREPGPLDLEQIYLVESDHDPTALLARRAGIDDGWLHWDDTNRDRVHRVGDVKQDGELVTVQTDRGFVYRFRPLTKELYDSKVREKVELSPAFGSTEELRDFYRNAVM